MTDRHPHPRPAGLQTLEQRLLLAGDVFAIGDSITYGTDSLATAGFRGPLEDLFIAQSTGNQLVGTLDNLAGEGNYTGVTNRGHFGIPGTTGDVLKTSLENNNGGGTDAFTVLDNAGDTPEQVLVHIGTNRINTGGGDDFNAAQDLDTLLTYIRNNSDLPASAQLYVARIIPKADQFDSGTLADGRAEVTNIAQYNYAAFNSVNTVTAPLANTQVVDFFAIPVSSLQSLSAGELAQADTDADGFVDWVLNFNEGDPLNTANLNGITDYNDDLLADGIHPTALGYKIMAEVWNDALNPPAPVGPAVPVVDFNNDGKTDIVWRNQGTGAAAGRTVIWLMDGENRIGTIESVKLNEVWELSGVADFNNDGNPDYWWRNTSTGRNTVWLLDASEQLTSATIVAERGTDWRPVGFGDFNADEAMDVYWHNTSTGAQEVTHLGGTNNLVIQSTDPANDRLNPSIFTPTVIADWDQDGRPDVIYRRTGTFISRAQILNGTNQVAVQDLPGKGAIFHLAAIGDYDGNGTNDLLWRRADIGFSQMWKFKTAGTDNTDPDDYDIRNPNRTGSDWQNPGAGIWY